jgi:hypothetical protein
MALTLIDSIRDRKYYKFLKRPPLPHLNQVHQRWLNQWLDPSMGYIGSIA